MTRVLLIALLLGTLAGCEPKVAVRGNLPREHQLAAIVPGVTEDQDIRRLLGAPSLTSTFDDSVWYYMGWQTEQYAFFEPKIIDYGVHVFTFNTERILRSHALYTKDDLRRIALNPETTPTSGVEITILEELFGNIGRFGVR